MPRWGWWMLVRASAAGAVPSKPTIERSPGTDRPRSRAASLGAERDRVAEREHRRAVRAVEQRVGAGAPRLDARQRALLQVGGCGGAGERLPAAGEAPAGDAVGTLAQGEAEQPDAAVAEREQVPDRLRGGRRVVDPDEVDAVDQRGVDEHGGQPALHRGGDQRVAGVEAVEHEAVDRRVAHGVALRLAVGQARHEHDREPVLVGRGREALQEEDGGGIVERACQAVVEHDADRGGAAAAQAARDRVGAGVAQLRRGLQHALAQRRRELIRPVVGVGDRARRHAERARDGDEPRLPRRGSVRGASCRLTSRVPYWNVSV